MDEGRTGTSDLAIVPANEASWDDLQAVFGTRGDRGRCQCQRYKLAAAGGVRARSRPRSALAGCASRPSCGHPESATTSGLVAYLDGEPVGWCAVEPRTAYAGLLRNNRVAVGGPGGGQGRRQRLGRDLLLHPRGVPPPRASPRARAGTRSTFARSRGARALEGYPMLTEPGQRITWGEIHVGSRSIFAAAGFEEVSRPTLRRVVMRIDF